MIPPRFHAFRSTILAWAATLLVEWALHRVVRAQPIWEDLLWPFMLLAPVPAIVVTWRMLRARSGRDRRSAERRAARRREQDERTGLHRQPQSPDL